MFKVNLQYTAIAVVLLLIRPAKGHVKACCPMIHELLKAYSLKIGCVQSLILMLWL